MVRFRSMRGRVLLTTALSIAVLPAIARAQQDPRETEAKKACLANRPDRGIELLAELYAESNDATYIYNQGRCYQQNGRSADALIRFREYLRKATGIAAGEKAEVERTIADLEDQQRKAQEATAAAAATAAAPGGDAGVVTTTPARDEHGAQRERRLRISGIVSASIGVAAILGGAYMGYQAQQLSDEVSADARKGMFSQSKYDEGERAETLQWVGYGVGVVAIVSGAALYVIGLGRGGDTGTTVTAMPVVGPRRKRGLAPHHLLTMRLPVCSRSLS